MKHDSAPTMSAHPSLGALMTVFERAMHRNQLHPAWLLFGEQGIGKAKVVSILAARLFFHFRTAARDYDHLLRQVEERTYQDFVEISADGSRISIAQLRDGLTKSMLKPGIGSWRVLFLNALDDCDLDAGNVLLKFLEEPPARTIIFLAAHKLSAVLPTIQSRAVSFGLWPERYREAKKPQAVTERYLSLIAAGNAGLWQRLLDIGQYGSVSFPQWSKLLEGVFSPDRNLLACERLAEILDGAQSQFYRRLFILCYEAIGAEALLQYRLGDRQLPADAFLKQAQRYHSFLRQLRLAFELNLVFKPLCYKLTAEREFCFMLASLIRR